MPRSPAEAGELSPSPGKKEERMEDESLDIKPPQAKKDKKKHKRKHKEHKKVKMKTPDRRIIVIDISDDFALDREATRERKRRDSVEEIEKPVKRADDRPDPELRARRDDRYDERHSRRDDKTIPRIDSRSSLPDYNRTSQLSQRYSPGGRERRDFREMSDIQPRRDAPRDSRRDIPRQPIRYEDDRRDRSRGARSAPFSEYRRADSPRRDDRRLDRSRSPRPPARDDRPPARDDQLRDERPRDARQMLDKRRVGEKRPERSESDTRETSRSRSDRGRITPTGDDKENKKESAADSRTQVVQISSSSEAESAEEETDNSEEEESEEGGSGESGSSEEESSGEEEGSGSEESGSESGDSDSQTEHGTRRRKKHKSKFESSDSESSENEKLSPPHDNESQHQENTPPGDDEMPDSPILSEPPSPPDKLPAYFPATQGCRSVDEFRHLNRIEEGTYGVVFRAEDLKLKEIVALKKLKMEKEKEGFPITSLREINTLLKTQHENIVTVREIVVGSNMDKIYLVMDFVEHDLKNLMEVMKNPFNIGEVKTLLCQLLKAVAHMHDNWILHRDLKTSNLLLSHKGILKVADFGLAREYGSPLKNYTPVVVTLWYRAPELLLGCKKYSCPIDMWSVGCIFAELILSKPLWQGKSEQDELNKIFRDLGTPNEEIWPGVKQLPAMQKVTFANYPYNSLRKRFDEMSSRFDDLANSLLNKFLTYDPSKRITAAEALHHEYFDAHPRPIDPSMFPTWPARSEQPRGTRRQKTPPPPSGGAAYKKITEDDAGGLFAGAGAGNSGFQLKF